LECRLSCLFVILTLLAAVYKRLYMESYPFGT
jgi:hypothetical protein